LVKNIVLVDLEGTAWITIQQTVLAQIIFPRKMTLSAEKATILQ